MSTIKPIIYILGVEGHFFLAQAMKEVFDRPIIGVISCERIHEMMTPEREAIFDKLYSLPNLHVENIDKISALSLKELNKQQTALEENLGVYNSSFLTFSDRRIQRIGNYRKIRNWQLLNLRLIDQILSENDPAFIIDGVVVYLQMALRKACEKRDIPYFLTMASRSNSFAMYNADGQQVGMQTMFDCLQNGDEGAMSSNVLNEADEALNVFLKKPIRPRYAVQNSTIKFNWPVLKHKLQLAFNRKKLLPSRRVKIIDMGMGAESSFLQIVTNFITMKYRRSVLKMLNTLDSSPDMDVPFVYVPLHYTPEISDLFFGPNYDHHESFIIQLAKYMPSDCALYVKEHTSMPGRRPVRFYKNLANLYNVRLIDPSVNTFDLIKNAQATITVTGTPGWEAFLLGKPSVAFGDVFFKALPGVLHADLKPGFEAIFKDYIDNFKPNSAVIKNAHRAYHASTFKAAKVDIGYTSDGTNAVNHAQEFCRAIKRTIEISYDDMQGDFDASLINKTSQQKK